VGSEKKPLAIRKTATGKKEDIILLKESQQSADTLFCRRRGKHIPKRRRNVKKKNQGSACPEHKNQRSSKTKLEKKKGEKGPVRIKG